MSQEQSILNRESKRTRRTFTKEFKKEAVKMVTEQGSRSAEVARNLGIKDCMLRRWKSELSTQNKEQEDTMNDEVKRLRKQVKRLEMERDILKKATARRRRIDCSCGAFANEKN